MVSIRRSLEENYKDKSILVLGFGKEGRSTYELLRSLKTNLNIYIMDQNDQVAKDYIAEKKDIDTIVLPKKEYLQGLEAFDLIFKTPGLPGYLLKDINIKKLSSQSQLFMEYLGDRCIGITGTKGKSTTSSIMVHILNDNGVKAKLVGNIGLPALESLLDDDGKTLYVYEMSSFQTEFLHVGPRIGVILNLFEEHLNNYLGYEAYQKSKLQLFKAQVDHPEKQILIYGCDNHVLLEKIKALRLEHDDRNYFTFGKTSKNSMADPGFFLEGNSIVKVSKNSKRSMISNTDFSRKILGEHNLLNSLVCFIIVDDLVEQGMIPSISNDQVIKSLSSFRGLAHRLEDVGEYEGIRFYNDSISTIPEATIKAIESIDNLGSLIIGGFDRKIGYHYLAKYLDQLEGVNILCLPETGHQVYELLVNKERAYKVCDMVEAISLAYEHTPKGRGCLLSPAASSYNQYKSFEERGDHFVQCIKAASTRDNNSYDKE